ncbi:DUF2284 domain-containing protein [Thermodesulfobacteriota bacterium]
MDFSLLLKEYKFTEYKSLDPKEISIDQSVRDMCEQNSCGQYGRNYMCPPHIKSLAECEMEIHSYKNAILFTRAYPKKSSFDFEGLMAAAIDFGKTIQKLREELQEKYPDQKFLFLGAGGCPVCKECACKDDEPCRFPDQAFSSVEANGIEVLRLCKELGVKYNNGNNSVTYMGMILYM